MPSFAHMDGKVSPDSSGEGSSRVGFTKHNTTSLHCVQTLPNLDEGNFTDMMRFGSTLLYIAGYVVKLFI